MAGIGFLLKNLVNRDRYASDLEANLYSLVISSGPWIFAVICVSALNAFAHLHMENREILLFRAVLIYVYAFSLITSSLFQLIFTRFISDKLYQREHDSLLPNLTGVLITTGLLNFLVSVLYVSFVPLALSIKIISVTLYCTVGFQWIVLVFLSSIRDYIKVTLSFIIGFLLSFAAGITLGSLLGEVGYLAGFTLGQAVTLLLLIRRIAREFPYGKDGPFEFARYIERYPMLFWSGFLYNLGFWIDKIMMWYSPMGYDVGDAFRAHYPYDSASFLAALTIMPALSFFFLQVETDFYAGLRGYINVILHKGTFEEVESARKSLTILLRSRLGDIFKIQFLVTLVILFLAPNIMQALDYNVSEIVLTFMLLLLGFFFQVMFLTVIVILWYLERLMDSLYCIITFLLLNTALNYIFIYHMSFIPPGTGFLITTLLSTVIAVTILFRRLKSLNFLTFMLAPLHRPRHEMPKFGTLTTPE